MHALACYKLAILCGKNPKAAGSNSARRLAGLYSAAAELRDKLKEEGGKVCTPLIIAHLTMTLIQAGIPVWGEPQGCRQQQRTASDRSLLGSCRAAGQT